MDYEVREDIISRRIGEEVFIIDLDGRVLHKLNQTGSFIWERISDGGDVKSISRELTEEFDVDMETAVDDIEEFIGVLSEKNIIS